MNKYGGCHPVFGGIMASWQPDDAVADETKADCAQPSDECGSGSCGHHDCEATAQQESRAVRERASWEAWMKGKPRPLE